MFKPVQYSKKIILSQVQSPAYRLILSIANYNRGLLLLAFNGNLFAAVFEGSTFGVIYLALRVLEEGSLENISRLSWLVTRIGNWSQGQLFISLILLAIFIQFLRSSLSYLGLVSAGYLKARIRAQMTEKVFRQIMSLSFSCASGYKVGDLTQYVQDSQEAVNKEIDQWNLLFIKVFIIVSYIFVLIAISPLLSIAAILLAGGLIAVQRFLIPTLRKNSREVVLAVVGVVQQIVESIQGLRLIHSFGQQRHSITQVYGLTQKLVPLIEKQERLIRIVQPLNEFLAVLTVGLLLILGFIILNDQNTLVVPALFTFIPALYRLSNQLGRFAEAVNILATNSGQMNRLNKILQNHDKELTRFGGKDFEKLRKNIHFEKVTLRYFADQAPALQNLDFALPKGSVTALVGGSGAGKSSIVDLLTGLYEPTEGRVTIDGVDLQEYSLETWQQKMGVVNQDTFIFNRSILENIRYGKPEATIEEVIKAAQDAQAHDFIEELPEGYGTLVGERGYRLSGGQRQRLALARAILKQPEVLILDEATSALDSQSEQLVQEALAMFQKDRTVLVVAHRLSTIVVADQIIVLEQGEIVERGTHQELLSKGKRYAHYWQLQAQGKVAVN